MEHTKERSIKRKRIAYWIFTIWMSLGMISSAVVQLMRIPEEVQNITSLGYPLYFLTIIGIWKICGVIVVLIPGFVVLKEWAYAGFVFVASGAAVSHIASGHGFGEVFPGLLLLALTLLSWWLRPAERKCDHSAKPAVAA